MDWVLLLFSQARASLLELDLFSLAFAQRETTAFLALSLRSSGVIFAARAGPPFRPPLRPNATAYGFLRFFAMALLYVSGLECQPLFS